jgi:hypothetical protein
VTHPSTPDWKKGGIDLVGPTWADQLVQVREAALVETLADPLAFAGDPFILDELATQLGAGMTPDKRLADAVARLGLDSNWIVHRLGDCWADR